MTSPDIPDEAVEAFGRAIYGIDWRNCTTPEVIAKGLVAAAPALTRQAVETATDSTYDAGRKTWQAITSEAVAAERERIATAIEPGREILAMDESFRAGFIEATERAARIARAEPDTDERPDHE